MALARKILMNSSAGDFALALQPSRLLLLASPLKCHYVPTVCQDHNKETSNRGQRSYERVALRGRVNSHYRDPIAQNCLTIKA